LQLILQEHQDDTSEHPVALAIVEVIFLELLEIQFCKGKGDENYGAITQSKRFA